MAEMPDTSLRRQTPLDPVISQAAAHVALLPTQFFSSSCLQAHQFPAVLRQFLVPAWGPLQVFRIGI